jgi:hypothetical protein
MLAIGGGVGPDMLVFLLRSFQGVSESGLEWVQALVTRRNQECVRLEFIESFRSRIQSGCSSRRGL